MNLRPSGYEPDELPDCSTPRRRTQVYHPRIVCKAPSSRGTVAPEMCTVLLILILIGALLALLAAVRAVRAYLRFRRVRLQLQSILTEELAHLARRTSELEKNLAALDARAQRLPVQILELQQNLATLRVLTTVLSASIIQARRFLSFPGLKAAGSSYIANLLRTPNTRTEKER